ncbi:hypothetical protein FI667_g10662, partial [Globisporangium splendens]
MHLDPPATSQSRQLERRNRRCEKKFDGVLPTAMEALKQRRSALLVLQCIDTLLRTDEVATERGIEKQQSVVVHGLGDEVTPGPGTYNPKRDAVNKKLHFVASFDAFSGRTQRTLPWELKKRHSVPGEKDFYIQQQTIWSGPGSYTASRADSIVRERVLSASFVQQPLQSESQQTLSPAHAALKAAQQTHIITSQSKSGFVGYRPVAKPNYRTLDQKKKIRFILAARTRWQRFGGHYNVNHTIVERQLGRTGIVPMAKQLGRPEFQSSIKGARANEKPVSKVQLRRRLRAWQSASKLETTSDPATKPAIPPHKQVRDVFKATPQWQRARARQLLKEKALKKKVGISDNQERLKPSHDQKPNLARLPDPDMSKQRGRDIVHCRQKQLKVVTYFNDRISKERAKKEMKRESEQELALKKGAKVPGIVPFEKLTGRDNVQVDARGVYILGREQDNAAGEAKALALESIDAYLRPHVPGAIISEPTEEDERFPMTKKIAKEREQLSILEPKYNLVEKSVQGHRHVHFEKQVDRPDVLQGANNQEDHDADQQLVLPSEFAILDKLRFPATSAFVNFNKMQGRATDRNPACDDKLTLEPQYELKQTRAPAPVNMAKMLSRAYIIPDDDKDQVLCKLRVNHEEIENAMRLLSKFKRQDVGAVDMKKHTTARFPESAHLSSFSKTTSSPRDLNVLSTKTCVNQTLVDMRKSIGRGWEHQNPAVSNQDTHSQSKDVHKSLILNVQDQILSTCRRSIAFVDIKKQVPRSISDHPATTTASATLAFMDPTRDSATTRFLVRKQQQRA